MEILKYLIVLLIIAFVSCTKKTTISDSRNDSVEKYLKLASIDTLPTEIRKKHNNKAFSFIDLEKNDSVVRWYLCEAALRYNWIKDSTNYYKVSKLHYSKSIEANDTINLARFYRYKAGYLKDTSKFLDSSYFYYLKSEKLYRKCADEEALGVIYYNKGSILSFINDFSGAELEYIKAEKIFKKFKNEKNLIYLANNYGNVYSNMLQLNKALDIYNDGLNRIYKCKDPSIKIQKSFLLTNIARVYSLKKQYRKSQECYEEALNYPNLIKKDLGLYSFILNGIGECKMELKMYEGLEKLFNRASYYSIEIQDNENLFYINKSMSQLYFLKKDTLIAQKHANEALLFARKTNTPYHVINALKQIGIVNKEKAASAIIEYDIQIDSLLNRERRERSKFLKIQFETDEIAQQKEKAIKQKWVQTSVITSVLLIVILLFIIYKQRSQKKEFILVQNQQKANEEIYQLMLNQQSKEEEAKQKEKKRIAIELHDNVMNKLASTRFNLFSLTRKTDSQSLEQAVHHIDSIKEVEDEIRNITHELSKETFSKSNSFASLLTQMINEQNQIHSTHYQLELDATINWDIISSEIKMNYYRIIQEAIHNCNKYALASQSTVSLLYEMNQLRLTIRDNGKGFEVEATKQGIGLQNMKQRMESIDGNISINSEPGKGTLINCSVEIEVN